MARPSPSLPSPPLEAAPPDLNAAIDALTRDAWRLERGLAESVLPPPRLPLRVLVAVDGTGAAPQAVAWAGEMARRSGGMVWVLSVVRPPDVVHHALDMLAWLGLPPSEVAQEETLEGHARVQAHARALHAAGVRAQGLLASGPPVPEILRLAGEKQAELVVVGAPDRGAEEGTGTGAAGLGSVAQGVLDHAHASVLLARTEPPPEAVLAATDGSQASKRAAAVAVALGASWGVPVRILYVFDPFAYGPLEEVRRRYARAVAPVRHRLGEDVTVDLAFGNPAREIVASAREARAGLVVMGSRGLGGLDSLAAGSVSRRVARASAASVLVVKP